MPWRQQAERGAISQTLPTAAHSQTVQQRQHALPHRQRRRGLLAEAFIVRAPAGGRSELAQANRSLLQCCHHVSFACVRHLKQRPLRLPPGQAIPRRCTRE